MTGKVLARELYDHVRDPAETQSRIDEPASADLLAARTLLHQAVPLDVPPSKR